MTTAAPRTSRISEAIGYGPCERCQAAAGDPCRTSAWRTTAPHRGRQRATNGIGIGAIALDCGAAPAPRRRTRRKPGMPAVHACTAALRDLVADFCRRHHGELHTTHSERVTTPDRVYGATWVVPTRFGNWLVHEPSDSFTPLISINTRFMHPEKVQPPIKGRPNFNDYSGKWNFIWTADHVAARASQPPAAAQSIMDDFERAARAIFPETEEPTR